VPIHRTYTPELLANGRRRYERTSEPVAAIAADFRIHPGSLRRLAGQLGWVRFNMAPRGLPQGSRLVAQAEELERRLTLTTPTPNPSPQEPAPGRAQARPGWGGEENAAALADTIDRLEKAVVEELASVEAMRAQFKGLPRRPREAETTARTLSSLTETLQKLQRLRCALPPSGLYDDDDMPADIDEFRHELARRIEAFLESRPDEDDAGADAARPLAAV
jgi:hypothetical protein